MADNWITKKVDKYVLVNQKLGSGAYGTVYRGFLAEDEKKQVAVKTIPIKVLKSIQKIISDTPKMLELIKREIAIMQKINHPNIVRLLDVARTNNYLYMFLEYCSDGDLKEFVQKKEEKRLSEVNFLLIYKLEAVIFMRHIVEGFKKLYEQKIIHRDIKPANILLSNGVAKITDFGFARVIESEMNDPAYLSRLGSPLYMAPQILEGQPFSAKCDVWSLGILFYELLYGNTPWMGDNPFNLLENIKNKALKFPVKPVRSQKVKELITQMLVVTEKDRITWDGVFNDPTVRIKEELIKLNNENLLKEKDEMSKSASMNRLYMEYNLVVGYLANNPINTLNQTLNLSQNNETMDERNRTDSEYKSGQTGEETDGELILSNYKNEKKKKDTLMKYYNYFIFERNISFFFNFVLQKLIKLQGDQVFVLQKENFYRLIYLISKNQMIHLERVHKQLNTKQHDKFDKISWGTFLASKEFTKVLNVIRQDLDNSLGFFQGIGRKTAEVQKAELEINPGSTIITKFMELYNNNFEATESFHSIYKDILYDNMKEIKLSKNNTKDSLLCLFYLNICLNPYSEFKEINYDFNKFYEENENMTQQEVQEKVLKFVK